MSEFDIFPEFEEKVRGAVSVPGAKPEFVNRLRNELVRGPVKMKARFTLRPVWVVTFVIVALALVMSAPTAANALKRVFGYVPNVGLVESTNGLRMLAEPVSLTREGVTLTITSVFVFEDRVELEYEVKGIDPANDGMQIKDSSTNPAFCGGVNIGEKDTKDGDAMLRLPDGTLLERALPGMYPKNVDVTKPVFVAAIPADVMEMTMILNCLPLAKRGTVPENWEAPFKLISVPAGTVVGVPVIEVQQPTQEPMLKPTASPLTDDLGLSSPVVKMTLEKFVPTDTRTFFYFSMDMDNRDPSLVSIMPASVSVIDSLGQKIQLSLSGAFQPYDHHAGSLFEYASTSKPADGSLTLVVENATAYYDPLHLEPPQATEEEMSFTFDAGANPQHGQTWQLGKEFVIAGYTVKINSARAVTWDDVKVPDWVDGSQGFDYGYQFDVESNPTLKMYVEMTLLSDKCGLTVGVPFLPESSSLQNTQLCRDGYPTGSVTATVWELAVLMEGEWQATWTPAH